MSSSDSEPGDAAPRVVMFAGPNGSGKSTINAAILKDPEFGFVGEYINADDIAKSLKVSMPDATDRERNIEAANQAEQRRLEALKNHRSFAFETVMSTPEKVALLTSAKAAGYDVTLVFVTTNNPELNVARVANRVALGGHAVEPEAIRQRYASTMQLLPCALEHADNAILVDNSASQPVMVAQKDSGRLERLVDQAPDWFNTIEESMQTRARSRDVMETAFRGKPGSDQAVLVDADASNGRTYEGPLLAVTDHHALQQVRTARFVIHDRSLLIPQELTLEKTSSSIRYAYEKGKLAQPSQDVTQKRSLKL